MRGAATSSVWACDKVPPLERQVHVVMRRAFSLLGLVMGNQGANRPTDRRVRHTTVRITSTAGASDGCLAPRMRRPGVRDQHRTRMTQEEAGVPGSGGHAHNGHLLQTVICYTRRSYGSLI